ncbi:hypothetical protein OO013_09570 [Mangrovivirga sp. M17]|uniref:Competence protein CoiA-like protein n=1 Tax=Mangrovivirga halotolerans TaxID=2993936 RepID=A0ABT3RRW5_9BACT|nr:hypothetical protein [Mangrovivirga halotolerans]MCX2744114.1 hypothetical protein [Mangrovivirga halotolerans]
MFKNPIALINDPKEGEIVTPSEARQLELKGINLNYFCPCENCKDSERILILARSPKGNYFFKHRPGFEHEWKPMTLLHLYMQEYIAKAGRIHIKGFITENFKVPQQIIPIIPLMTIVEDNSHENIRFDATVFSESGLKIAIEVVVTNDITKQKAEKIRESGIPTIRIDLSHFYFDNRLKCQSDPEFVKSHTKGLFEDIVNQDWVQKPSKKEVREHFKFEEKKDEAGWGIVALIFGVIVIFGISNSCQGNTFKSRSYFN